MIAALYVLEGLGYVGIIVGFGLLLVTGTRS